MRTVFADTVYWIATLNPRDELHQKARSVSEKMNPCFLVTSEMVLVELLNAFSDKGERLRKASANLAHLLKSTSDCEVVPQTSILFRDALNRYEERCDKSWSLTDCASFLIMEEKRITEALTHDRHFIQAGFAAMLRDEEE